MDLNRNDQARRSSRGGAAPGPLLAIPPFPGAKVSLFASPANASKEDVVAINAALARHRVGGCFWGSQPRIAQSSFVLDGTSSPAPSAIPWPDDADPWYLLDRATCVRLPRGDWRGILAIAAGCTLTIVAADGSERHGEDDLGTLMAAGLFSWRWRNPFDGRDLSLTEAIELCGFWRALIDSNRLIRSVLGIAEWKRLTVAPLLWGGHEVPFDVQLNAGAEEEAVAVWKSRLTRAQRADIERFRPRLIEVEDGFIRSVGLGANCVPPQSIVVDTAGVHFDPTAPSDLEALIEQGCFSSELLERAERLRQQIVRSGVSKYGSSQHTILPRPGGDRRHVLVVGQVEDDRAVTSGLALPSNLELLRRARDEAGPDAFVIYKPHPDVVAGHRKGDIVIRDVIELADLVETKAPMTSLFAAVDEIHVNTSLAGFEALLRGKLVVVHGVPFYAGWGLTTDRGAIPHRRTAVRTLDELVAATLIVYPRYIDPETGLPCPVEALVDRMASGTIRLPMRARTLVAFRRLLGRFTRLFASP